jgi:heme-degrading monooxygenase HmoA
MIVRISRMKIDQSKTAEYERHQSQDLPMLLKQEGFISVLLVRGKDDYATISLWDDMKAVEAFLASPAYAESQKRLDETGTLTSKESVEVLEVKGGFTRPTEQVYEAPTPE